jgi:hypothetical protein
MAKPDGETDELQSEPVDFERRMLLKACFTSEADKVLLRREVYHRESSRSPTHPCKFNHPAL